MSLCMRGKQLHSDQDTSEGIHFVDRIPSSKHDLCREISETRK